MAIGAAVAAAGCGGGTTGGAGPAAQSHTAKVGQAVVSYFGQPKPLTATTSGSVSVLSQAGATYSKIQMQPAPNLDSTYLVLAREGSNSGALYKLTYPSAQSQLLFQNQEQSLSPTISAYGTVAFANFAITSGATDLENIRNDGTGLATIKYTNAGDGPIYSASFSTDGTNRVAFQQGDAFIYIGPGSGGSATLVQEVGTFGPVAWNPAGTKLIYRAGSVGGHEDLFTSLTTGGSQTDVTPLTLMDTGDFDSPVWSPDGATVAATYTPDGGSTSELVVFNLTPSYSYTVVTPAGDSDILPVFSPDGSRLMFYRTNANGQTPGLYETDPEGFNVSLFCADGPNELNTGASLSWSPFLPKETVVATSGSTFYHQAASGFLLSEIGDQFGSFVTFTANTPADAAIQAPGTTLVGEGAQLIFTVTADSITSFGYINNYFSPGTTISLSSTPTVIVTVDGTTGQVDLVAPATVAKPTVVKNADGTITYSAPFRSLYDGKGKNLAPNGAGQVTLNPQTGKLVSFR